MKRDAKPSADASLFDGNNGGNEFVSTLPSYECNYYCSENEMMEVTNADAHCSLYRMNGIHETRTHRKKKVKNNQTKIKKTKSRVLSSVFARHIFFSEQTCSVWQHDASFLLRPNSTNMGSDGPISLPFAFPPFPLPNPARSGPVRSPNRPPPHPAPSFQCLSSSSRMTCVDGLSRLSLLNTQYLKVTSRSTGTVATKRLTNASLPCGDIP